MTKSSITYEMEILLQRKTNFQFKYFLSTQIHGILKLTCPLDTKGSIPTFYNEEITQD